MQEDQKDKPLITSDVEYVYIENKCKDGTYIYEAKAIDGKIRIRHWVRHGKKHLKHLNLIILNCLLIN